jgi:hypothetical protein
LAVVDPSPEHDENQVTSVNWVELFKTDRCFADAVAAGMGAINVDLKV